MLIAGLLGLQLFIQAQGRVLKCLRDDDRPVIAIAIFMVLRTWPVNFGFFCFFFCHSVSSIENQSIQRLNTSDVLMPPKAKLLLIT